MVTKKRKKLSTIVGQWSTKQNPLRLADLIALNERYMVAEHIDQNTMVIKGVKLLVPTSHKKCDGYAKDLTEEIGDANFDYTIRRIKADRIEMVKDKKTGNLYEDQQYLVEWDSQQVQDHQPTEEWVSQHRLSIADRAIRDYERNKHRLDYVTGGAGTVCSHSAAEYYLQHPKLKVKGNAQEAIQNYNIQALQGECPLAPASNNPVLPRLAASTETVMAIYCKYWSVKARSSHGSTRRRCPRLSSRRQRVFTHLLQIQRPISVWSHGLHPIEQALR